MNLPNIQKKKIFCASAFTPSGWVNDCVLNIDDSGRIESITFEDSENADLVLSGVVVPGVPNIHSHAHQKLIAGLAEFRVPEKDNFWGWRELMYKANANLNPDQMYTIACYLYATMLEQGYTSVTEFHYLHHQINGQRYSNCAEFSASILSAASDVGIAITLMPAFYCRGGFRNEPVSDIQKRFVNNSDSYLEILQSCCDMCLGNPNQSVGFAAHSLRAVEPTKISSVLDNVELMLNRFPIHIHIAEQILEVEQCIEVNGVRPITWLFDQCEIDENWCLIHATHANSGELKKIIKSKAVVGLCPTTEANLGDGIFPANSLIQNDGFFGIGSDSQISISPPEELKFLEYTQRLVNKKRMVLATKQFANNGVSLLNDAVIGGNKARGEIKSGIMPGARGDLIELNDKNNSCHSLTPDQVVNNWIFTNPNKMVQGVIVGGRQVVYDHAHPQKQKFSKSYQKMVSETNIF